MGLGSGILDGHMVFGQVMLSWWTAGSKTTRPGGQFKNKFTNLATCTKQDEDKCSYLPGVVHDTNWIREMSLFRLESSVSVLAVAK